MKSLTRYLTLHVPARMDFVKLTEDVERAVAESGVAEGLCLVNAMHITASVFINDDEPGLHQDYKRWLEQLAPFDPSPVTKAARPARFNKSRRSSIPLPPKLFCRELVITRLTLPRARSHHGMRTATNVAPDNCKSIELSQRPPPLRRNEKPRSHAATGAFPSRRRFDQ